jgi:hypothetical protein
MTNRAHSSNGNRPGSSQPKSRPGHESDPTPIGRSCQRKPACSTSNKSEDSTDDLILKDVLRTLDWRGIRPPKDVLSLVQSPVDGISGIVNQLDRDLSAATIRALALNARLSMDRSTSPLVLDTLRSQALGMLVAYQRYRVDLRRCGLLEQDGTDQTTSATCS